MEQALIARVYGVADPTEVADLSYVEGFRGAARAAVDFALVALEGRDDDPPLVPPALLSQARLAARNEVGLDTVLRRYAAGHALFVDFLVEAVEDDRTFPPTELRRLLAVSSSAFDRLLAAVSEEHARELKDRLGFSRERRRAKRVERLLAGEPTDVSDLAYDFDRWHLGVAAQGRNSREQIRDLAATLDCRSLVISRDDELVWVWLGSSRPLDVAPVVASAARFGTLSIGVGEPANTLAGWRLTHRQAVVALSVGLRSPDSVVRYAKVAFLAAVLENDLAVTSLRRLYLDPLCDERDGGEALRGTLRAYFAAERNVSSAAALLGVTRRTISNRLRAIEEKLGGPIESSAAELKTALQVAEFQEADAAMEYSAPVQQSSET